MSKIKGGEDVPLGQPLRMRLAQKGLRNAELVIWAMSKQNGERFLDIRLWFSKEVAGQWMPSKKGVRVPVDELPVLQKLLDSKSGESLLSHTASRELHGRWMEDISGRAFDLRYFIRTSSYTGWDKRGVRIREEDCQLMRTHLVDVEEILGTVGMSHHEEKSSKKMMLAQDVLAAIIK